MTSPTPTAQQVATTKALGALVRRHRKARGLRQDQLASLSNVSTGDFEKGKETAQVGKILHAWYGDQPVGRLWRDAANADWRDLEAMSMK